MCGRYTLATPEPILQDVFELGAVPELVARYNMAPTQLVPAVIEYADAGERRMEMLR